SLSARRPGPVYVRRTWFCTGRAYADTYPGTPSATPAALARCVAAAQPGVMCFDRPAAARRPSRYGTCAAAGTVVSGGPRGRGVGFEVEPVRGGELDGGGAHDFFGERAEPDSVPVDDRSDAVVAPDDVAVLEVAVGPAARSQGVVGRGALIGVGLDQLDTPVEQ